MPKRRSTSQAVQILTMHLFGDAGSPYLLGVVSFYHFHILLTLNVKKMNKNDFADV